MNNSHVFSTSATLVLKNLGMCRVSDVTTPIQRDAQFWTSALVLVLALATVAGAVTRPAAGAAIVGDNGDDGGGDDGGGSSDGGGGDSGRGGNVDGVSADDDFSDNGGFGGGDGCGRGDSNSDSDDGGGDGDGEKTTIN